MHCFLQESRKQLILLALLGWRWSQSVQPDARNKPTNETAEEESSLQMLCSFIDAGKCREVCKTHPNTEV